MAKLFYYNENGEKIGVASSEELEALAAQGIITPQTTIETTAGRKGLAKEVKGKDGKGLTFAKTVQSKSATDESVHIDRNTPRNVLERESANNNPAALLYIASHSAHGTNGFDKGEARKIEFYKKGAALADQGSLAAQYCQGVCYTMGYGVDEDKEKAAQQFRQVAEQGFAMAQSALGRCYMLGDGVETDQNEAVKWMQKAAEQDDPIGQFFLGLFYHRGLGVTQNIEEAIRWYHQSAEQEFDMAQSALAWFQNEAKQGDEEVKHALEKIEAEAFVRYRKEAERGNPEAMFNLGICYSFGKGVAEDKTEAYLEGYGVEQNINEAIKWMQKAAEKGHAEAQHELGMCYYEGNGVDKNMREAIKWCRKAAEQGYAQSQFSLGAAYANGEGVDKDAKEAAKWLHKAAEQGNPFAQYELANFYLNGVGVEKDFETAIDWFRHASEQGYEEAQRTLDHIGTRMMENNREAAERGEAESQFWVGVCFLKGLGVEANWQEADRWFGKAAEQGHEQARQVAATIRVGIFKYAAEQGDPEAQFKLGLCYKIGEGIDKDMAEAVKWLRKAAEQGLADSQYVLALCYGEAMEAVKS